MFGLRELQKSVMKKRQEKDIYVVGAANIGKSTLVANIVPMITATWQRQRHGESKSHNRDAKKLINRRLKWLNEVQLSRGSRVLVIV